MQANGKVTWHLLPCAVGLRTVSNHWQLAKADPPCLCAECVCPPILPALTLLARVPLQRQCALMRCLEGTLMAINALYEWAHSAAGSPTLVARLLSRAAC